MLDNLAIVLVRPKLPENIGMAARAMANMGARRLLLVAPERWSPAHREKALSTATPQARLILESAEVFGTLAEALAPFSLAVGATARTGGQRKEVLTPEAAARRIRSVARQKAACALVFGSEDRGLENEETALCTELATITTAEGCSSLNLAQAVLVFLYECQKACLALPFSPNKDQQWTRPATEPGSRPATLEEEQRLFAELEKMLVLVGRLPVHNPEWFMRALRRFLRKSRLRRHEYDMLMGIFWQVGFALRPGNGEPET